MIWVDPRQRDGVDPFHNYIPRKYISNHLLSDPNGAHMKKLFPQEFDVYPQATKENIVCKNLSLAKFTY
jgi:hypothetical protein